MRISISDSKFPGELEGIPVRSRVRLVVELEVDSVSQEGGFHLAGEVRDLDVKSVHGIGGVSPYTANAEEILKSLRPLTTATQG